MGLRRLAFRLFLIVLPLLTVAAVLYFGHGPLPLSGPEWKAPAPPEIRAAQLPGEWSMQLRFRLPDGSAAVGAYVVLLEPSLAVARVQESGLAHLRYLGEGPFRLQAFYPGHVPLNSGTFQDAPEGGFQFEVVARPDIELPPKRVPITREFVLSRAGAPGEPLALALVLGVTQADPEAAPWIALSDPEGQVRLVGTLPESMRFDVFAPGLLPEAAWRLDTLSAGAEEGHRDPYIWRIDWAEVEFESLPIGEPILGERLDVSAPLPGFRCDDRGRLRIEVLPPGLYRFEADGRQWEGELRVGLNRLTFPNEG